MSDWIRSPMINKFVLWCAPLPTFARHAFREAMSIWVEPLTSCGHIFFIPRILQRQFGRLSKFIHFHGQYDNLPLSFTPLVPIVLYYITPFNRMEIYHREQQTNRMGTPPDVVPSWIRK